MAAPTYSLIGTVITSADSATNWSAGALDTDSEIQGTGCIGNKVSNATQIFLYDYSGTGSFDFSAGGADWGNVIVVWLNCLTPTLDTLTNGGLRIQVGDGTNTGDWYVGGDGSVAGDPYKGGWFPFVVHPNTQFDAVTGSWTTSGNPGQLTAVDRFGGVVKTVSTIMGNFNNGLIDQIVVGEGLRIEDGDPSDPATFTGLVAADEGTKNNKYGFVRSDSGVIFAQGKIEVGHDTGTTTTYFEDSGKKIIFTDAPVLDYATMIATTDHTDIDIDFIDGGGGADDIQRDDTGDFGTDGFQEGMTVEVFGADTSANNGTYQIDAVATTTTTNDTLELPTASLDATNSLTNQEVSLFAKGSYGIQIQNNTTFILGDRVGSSTSNGVLISSPNKRWYMDIDDSTVNRIEFNSCTFEHGGYQRIGTESNTLTGYIVYDQIGTLTFNENGGSPDTIVRSTGSWLTEGFEPGQEIIVSGTASNDGTYTINTVVALTITLITADDVVQENTVSNVSLHSTPIILRDCTWSDCDEVIFGFSDALITASRANNKITNSISNASAGLKIINTEFFNALSTEFVVQNSNAMTSIDDAVTEQLNVFEHDWNSNQMYIRCHANKSWVVVDPVWTPVTADQSKFRFADGTGLIFEAFTYTLKVQETDGTAISGAEVYAYEGASLEDMIVQEQTDANGNIPALTFIIGSLFLDNGAQTAVFSLSRGGFAQKVYKYGKLGTAVPLTVDAPVSQVVTMLDDPDITEATQATALSDMNITNSAPSGYNFNVAGTITRLSGTWDASIGYGTELTISGSENSGENDGVYIVLERTSSTVLDINIVFNPSLTTNTNDTTATISLKKISFQDFGLDNAAPASYDFSTTETPDRLIRSDGVWSPSLSAGSYIKVADAEDTNNNGLYKVSARVSDTVIEIEGTWGTDNTTDTTAIVQAVFSGVHLFSYDASNSSFVKGEVVTNSGGTKVGYVVDDFNDGSTGTVVISHYVTAHFVDNEDIYDGTVTTIRATADIATNEQYFTWIIFAGDQAGTAVYDYISAKLADTEANVDETIIERLIEWGEEVRASPITVNGTGNYVVNRGRIDGTTNSIGEGVYISDLSTGSFASIEDDLGVDYIPPASATMTITGLKTGSEVRILLAGTNTELDGVESSTTSFGHGYTTPAGNVDIVILHEDWQYLFLDNIARPSSNSSLPVQQITDRINEDPAGI